MYFSSKSLLPLLLSMPLWLAGEIIGESDAAITYRQNDGSEVELKKSPERVVICYRSLAAIWDQAGGRAVGIMGGNDDSILPESMVELPRIGQGMTPNLEKVMLLKPDLVLLSDQISRHRDAAAQLRQAGISAIQLRCDNYHDYHAMLELFSRLNCDKDAEAGLLELSKEVEAICLEAKKMPSKRCAIVFVANSRFSLESAESHTGTILEMLGAENIRESRTPIRIPFSFEQLILDDPERIFIVSMGDSDGLQEQFRREFMQLPAWKGLSAVKQNQVHFLDPGLFLFQPGPRYPDAFKILAALLKDR